MCCLGEIAKKYYINISTDTQPIVYYIPITLSVGR